VCLWCIRPTWETFIICSCLITDVSEPQFREYKRQIASKTSELRNKAGDAVANVLPEFKGRNIGNANLIATYYAAAASTFGGNIDLVSMEQVDDSTVRYTVHVEGITRNNARARSFLSSGNGLASYVVDNISAENVEVVTERVLIDTYEAVILIEE
jgi:hypothetical protein